MRLCLVAAVSAAGLATRAAGQCEPQWLPGDPGLGLSTPPFELATWDPDGPGPLLEQLVAGGGFTHAGTTAANCVARWDGLRWWALGSGLEVGTYPTGGPRVYALAGMDPDGPGPAEHVLIAAGDFHLAGGIPVNGIAAWDNSAWAGLGEGLGIVRALTMWDADGPGPLAPQLVAGGQVADQGPGFVARWDGSRWIMLDSGAVYNVRSLVSWDPDAGGPEPAQLIAAGAFHNPNFDNVARWDGEQWSQLGATFDGHVYALLSWDPDGSGPASPALICGGEFRHELSAPDNWIWGVASWDSSSWRAMDQGFVGEYPGIGGFYAWDTDGDGPLTPRLLACGGFGGPGGNIALWSGAEWHDFQGGLTGEFVYDMTGWDPDGDGPQRSQLFVGGLFTRAGGVQVQNFARWVETVFPWIVVPPLDTTVRADRSASFSAQPSAGYQMLPYKWRRNGTDLRYGPGGASPGGGAVSIPGGTLLDGQAATLMIEGVRPSDAGSYDCVVTHPCGEVVTSPAVLAVTCPADLDHDGVVDFIDFLVFLNSYDSGDSGGDLDGDGVVDFTDYLEFLNHYEAGC